MASIQILNKIPHLNIRPTPLPPPPSTLQSVVEESLIFTVHSFYHPIYYVILLAIYNGNCTEWSAIWSEIKCVTAKSHDGKAGVRFVITSLISDKNCTPLRAISTLLHSF